VLWLLYIPPYECVMFTIFNALLEGGGYYMYRIMNVWCFAIFNALLVCGGYYMYRIMNMCCILYLMPY